MKKLFSFLLALCMTISLAACGQQVGSGGTSSTAGSGASGSTQGGSDWPTRPVNITVAASAGGATDILVRMYAEKFQEVTGQPLVVTNISGASAYVTASTASPDGYNFGTMSTAFLTYKHQGMVDFTWDEGYEMAAMVGTSALIGFVVPSDSPYETINDLVDAAKANPGTITVGNGQGTPYYWQLAFQKATNTDFYTVHLGDTNELNVALLGGQVDVVVSRYLTLGQPTSTLSGGEIQRVKLASELHKEGNLYILDEPTTGLHEKDVETLLSLLRRLVVQRNTVVIVEHRLELISRADWIIDMGPGGGSGGGEVLFCGTPEQLIACRRSKTGRYLMQDS